MNEVALMHAFARAVPFTLPHVRVFRREIINAKSDRGVWLKAGIPGQADLYAVARGGLHVEIETKSATGALMPKQQRWRAFCVAFGIPYLMPKALPNESPEATVARWVNDLRTCIEAHEHRPRV